MRLPHALQCGSVLHIYPAFLAYFNGAVGGPAGGVLYVEDSNLGWGQDLRRLRAFVDAQQIDRIAVAYFGGSSPHYELARRYLPWHSALGPYKGWLAVSATSWQIPQALRASRPEDAYEWLQGKVPVARIGYSILVYDLRDLQLPWPHGLEARGYEAVRPERTQAGAEADDPSSTVERPPPHAAIGDHPASFNPAPHRSGRATFRHPGGNS